MTVREKIQSHIEEKEGKLVPKRTAKELEEAVKEKTVLDQEFESRAEGDYTTIGIEGLLTKAAAVPVQDGDSPDLNVQSIRHTDGYLIDGEVVNTLVCKTSTEVLDYLVNGKYMAAKFQVNFRKSDSDAVETGLRDFTPRNYFLPRSRRSTTVRDNMIIVEPNLNGFSITVFIEDLDDISYQELQELITWITGYQGYLLEETIRRLSDLGVPSEELVKSQTTVGLVRKTRNIFEKKKMVQMGEEHRTAGIVEESSNFANELNDYLALQPLTDTSVEFGVQVFTVEVTDDPLVKGTWTSARRNFSYFQKGNTQGRVNRVGGNVRQIPVVQDMIPDVEKTLWTLIPTTLTRFENAARRQVGYKSLLPNVPLPKEKKARSNNVADLLKVSATDAFKISRSYSEKALQFLQQYLKEDKANKIQSLLTLFATQSQNPEA